jgi:hypothetical protein
LSGFLLRSLYLYPVNLIKNINTNKHAYIFVDLCNRGRGSNSITRIPLAFTELEQILNDTELDDI